MKWLDAPIDGMRRMLYRLLPWAPFRLVATFGPFSRVGSIFNLVASTAIVVTRFVYALGDEPAAVVALVPGVLLVVLFVRICVRAWRGDFYGDRDLA